LIGTYKAKTRRTMITIAMMAQIKMRKRRRKFGSWFLEIGFSSGNVSFQTRYQVQQTQVQK